MVPVCPTERFFQDVVDDSKPFQVVAGESECRGGFRGMLVTLPQDPGTAFRANDAVVGVLHDGNPVSDTDAERAT